MKVSIIYPQEPKFAYQSGNRFLKSPRNDAPICSPKYLMNAVQSFSLEIRDAH